MPVDVLEEHRWLARMAGEWTYEVEVDASTGQPSTTQTGREHVRTLGDLWVVGEAREDGGDGHASILTLGVDPARGLFVGTFVASMMPNLWLYEGTRDGESLVLRTEGPSFTDEGKTAEYRDVLALDGDDRRTLTSHQRGADGEWRAFMTMRYRRVR